MECKLKKFTDEGIIGEILNVSVDERVLNEEGSVDPLKLEAISYDPVNHFYLKVSEKVGNAFSDGNKIK